MAFNPFHGFRKYRKTMFAVLTILCMFVFVLSSGLGGRSDLLSGAWLGGSRYPTVAKIDGRNIDTQEMQTVANQRRLANEFIRQTLFFSDMAVIDAVNSKIDDFPEIGRQQVRQAVFYKQFGQQHAQLLQQYLQMIPGFLRSLDTGIKILENDKKAGVADVFRRFQQVLVRDNNRPDYYGQLYFGGSTRTGGDLLDFEVWKWEADKHKIELSTDAVQKMLREEIGGSEADEAADQAMKNIRAQYTKISQGALLGALTDEFRVRLAKTAILGETSKLPGTIGAYVTPYEFYQFYRDMRTAIRVDLLPVTADSFLSKVTEKPSENDLKTLFNKYRGDEPNPLSERPGFKAAKESKVEWVGFKGEEPLIKKAALEDASKKSETAAAIGKAITAPPGDSAAAIFGRLGAIAVVDDPKLIEKRTDKEYADYVKSENSALYWVQPALALFKVHDTSLYQPNAVAATVAGMLGARGTGGSALTSYIALGSQAVVQEMRERVRFGLFPLALGQRGSTALLAMSDAFIPRPLPKKALQAKLNDEVTKSIVDDYFKNETDQFMKTLAEKAKDPKKPETKQEVRKYVDEFVKKFGLPHGVSAKFDDQFEMIHDQGLTPLKELYEKDFKSTDPKGYFFGSRFFQQMDRSLGQPMPIPLFQAHWFNDLFPIVGFTKPEDKFFVVWRTEEKEPHSRTFDEAKSDVEKAWKLEKARELAAKAAESLNKELNDKGIKNLASLKDFAQGKYDLVEVGPIAMRQESFQGMARGITMYEPPQTPRDKVPYGAPDFAVKLMDLREKPLGSTIVLSDDPKDTQYVAVLIEKTEPTKLSFDLIYKRSGLERGADPLMSEFLQRQRAKARAEIITQLREDAKLTIVDQEELKRFAEKSSSGE